MTLTDNNKWGTALSEKRGWGYDDWSGGFEGPGSDIDDPKSGIGWVIAGGESGHGARPMHPDWVRSLRDQCAAADVPFFFKQWGEWLPITYKAALFANKGTFGHWGYKKESFWKTYINDEEFPGSVNMERVGKKLAGRLLDGVEHNTFPV
jgi:hypothetical protein